MSVLPNTNIYSEISAAQLLRPRMDLLTKDGGLNYKELNDRICAENRTEGIPVDHNPVYGGISKEVCGVERQESFTISDKLLSFDKLGYFIAPRKIIVKTPQDIEAKKASTTLTSEEPNASTLTAEAITAGTEGNKLSFNISMH